MTFVGITSHRNGDVIAITNSGTAFKLEMYIADERGNTAYRWVVIAIAPPLISPDTFLSTQPAKKNKKGRE